MNILLMVGVSQTISQFRLVGHQPIAKSAVTEDAGYLLLKKQDIIIQVP